MALWGDESIASSLMKRLNLNPLLLSKSEEEQAALPEFQSHKNIKNRS